ncbi:MAG: cobalt ECF transporter T component CbiQ [Methanothrix sp.]|jgi:cobalt/nickel transport system permease protein|nr:cobalt ECF transporter T component CbiQ [Methanothrix sp.]
MSSFDLERYSDLNSPLHRWETRVKLISLFVLIISIVIAVEVSQALAGLIVSMLLVLISGLPFHHVLGFMKWPFFFLLPLLVILPITTEGEALFSYHFLTLSSQGLHLGLLFMIRGIAAALLALIMAGTAPFNVNINALKSLGMPGPLTQIFLFAYRYIFLLNEDLQTMRRSLASKGFEMRSSARSARIMAMAVAMLLIRSYERSEDVFNAMISRGYQGRLPSGQKIMIKGSDLLKGFSVVAAALLIQFV